MTGEWVLRPRLRSTPVSLPLEVPTVVDLVETGPWVEQALRLFMSGDSTVKRQGEEHNDSRKRDGTGKLRVGTSPYVDRRDPGNDEVASSRVVSSRVCIGRSNKGPGKVTGTPSEEYLRGTEICSCLD